MVISVSRNIYDQNPFLLAKKSPDSLGKNQFMRVYPVHASINQSREPNMRHKHVHTELKCIAVQLLHIFCQTLPPGSWLRGGISVLNIFFHLLRLPCIRQLLLFFFPRVPGCMVLRCGEKKENTLTTKLI